VANVLFGCGFTIPTFDWVDLIYIYCVTVYNYNYRQRYLWNSISSSLSGVCFNERRLIMFLVRNHTCISIAGLKRNRQPVKYHRRIDSETTSLQQQYVTNVRQTDEKGGGALNET